MRAPAFVRSGAVAVAVAGAQVLPFTEARAYEPKSEKTAVYEEVWRLARDKFYDPKMKGLDWEAMGNKHRFAYLAAKTDAQRSAAINALLTELGASHTRHYTKDETAYYELVDIFSYPLRRDIPKSSRPSTRLRHSIAGLQSSSSPIRIRVGTVMLSLKPMQRG
jgi:carboxyl-terminal processing protease